MDNVDSIDFINNIDMEDLELMDNYRDIIIRERVNPFQYYSDENFKKRYRFTKYFANKIVDLVKDDLPCDPRGGSLGPQLQVACALRCWARHQINLRLILVSGKTKEFVFSPVDSAGDIAVHVYDNWPEADWASECVSRAEILRLIYQGRFLHSSVTLGALGLPMGRTTVMHLVPREHLPEPNSHDQRQKSKGGSSNCCTPSCCIL